MSRKKLTTEEFVERAISIHGDKYNYKLSHYVNSHTKIKINCKTHGIFKQTPSDHLRGKGCPKCAGKNKTTDEFIKKSMLIHNDKYDYSLTDYLKDNKKVKIICPIHGEFEQTPNSHLNGRGCQKCGYNVRKTTQNVIINSFMQTHKDKYDYSLIDYINTRTKVKIICPIHGEFKQTPHGHLNGQGCPICKESKGEREIRNYLLENNIKFIREHIFPECRNVKPLPFDFYLPDYNVCIEFHGKQHYESIKGFGGENRFKNQLIRDNIKIEYCKSNNITLLIIPFKKKINNELPIFFQ